MTLYTNSPFTGSTFTNDCNKIKWTLIIIILQEHVFIYTNMPKMKYSYM